MTKQIKSFGGKMKKIDFKFIDRLSKAAAAGSAAGRSLRKCVEQSLKHRKTYQIKAVFKLRRMPKQYLNELSRYYDSLAFLSYCGISPTEEVIKEIKEVSESTQMNFNQACHYYVNKKSIE